MQNKESGAKKQGDPRITPRKWHSQDTSEVNSERTKEVAPKPGGTQRHNQQDSTIKWNHGQSASDQGPVRTETSIAVFQGFFTVYRYQSAFAREHFESYLLQVSVFVFPSIQIELLLLFY